MFPKDIVRYYNFFLTFVYVGVSICFPWGVCVKVREQFEGVNSPPTMWVLGFKLRSSGFVASAFTCKATLTT